MHIAIKEGNLDVVRVLLTESQIDAEAMNFKGRNPLHILANFGSDNAVAIFDLFMECMPNFPLDKTDTEGNTGHFKDILLFEACNFEKKSNFSFLQPYYWLT